MCHIHSDDGYVIITRKVPLLDPSPGAHRTQEHTCATHDEVLLVQLTQNNNNNNIIGCLMSP